MPLVLIEVPVSITGKVDLLSAEVEAKAYIFASSEYRKLIK
jgi:hypothetical protein